jgi:hypothetical protein
VVTYHKDVSRILQRNCVECHHEGGLAPFALDDLAEVQDRAKTMLRAIDEGIMPPWFAKQDSKQPHSMFGNDRSLSERDRADLVSWLKSTEKPVGDVADAPAPLKFSADGWLHGKPDHVVVFPSAQQVKAEGKMPYVNVTVDAGATEDRWIQGYQLLPGAREVVHHVLVFLSDRSGRKFQERDGFFAAYVPGSGVEMFPAGFAKKLPAGSQLRFQMHYTPNGKATADITRIGFYFSKQQPVNEVHVASIANNKFAIPPGAADHEVVAQRPAPVDMHLMSFMPHMHVS